MALSWIAGIIIGVIVGLVVHLAARVGARSPLWATVAVGIVGAIIGRFLLVGTVRWHPHAVGGLIGAIVLSVIWAGVMRSRRPKQ